jgi:endonuclease I
MNYCVKCTRLKLAVIFASWAIVCSTGTSVLRANDTDYEPSSTYYSSAAGLTGSALQTQLRTIMTTGSVGRSYGDFRYASSIIDADPNNSGNILLVYNRASVSSSWDSGTTWNREHTWPVSLLGTSDPSNSTIDARTDMFMLRPCNPSLNSARSNEYFGSASSTGSYTDYGSYWFPGDADKGDLARAMFYFVTRYPTYGGNTLSLVNGAPTTYQMGDLNSLLHWNYTDVPDTFERHRNQAIYSSTLNPTYYQGNRNAFIDHPEYVWSIFVDQANDTSIATSTNSVDLGRVIVGSSFGTQSVTVNKTGVDGTYYSVTTSGDATSTVTGHNNAFAMDSAGSKNTTIGLGSSTATAGLKTGTVTVDNLDITTQGGAGKGANDADDVVVVTGAVLDHAAPSLSAISATSSLTLDFGNLQQSSGSHTLTFDLCNLMQTAGYTARLDLDSFSFSGDAGVFSSNLAAFSNLDAGSSQEFSIFCDTSLLGSFSGTYVLACSDENIAGAVSFSPLTVNLVGHVAAPEPTEAAMALVFFATLFLSSVIRRRQRRCKGV